MQSDEELRAAFEAGGKAWPSVSLSYQDFAAHMRLLDVASVDLAVRSADLFLTSACAEGDPRALRAFDQAFIAGVDAYLLRSGVPRGLLDEVHQKVRVKLLVGPSPAIAGFAGRGPLGLWVRVTAARVAVDVAAAANTPERQPDGDMLDRLISLEPSPEMQAVKARYRDRFRAALEESLLALGERDRTILSLHFVDGLNIGAIGVVYRVHRATVARWLLAIRASVFADLQRRFALSLGSSPSELRSLVNLFQDDVQLSARRLLAQP